VGIERLRPNLVLAGVEAHDEDRLAELRIATADGGGAQARQALRALPHPQHRPADGREQPRVLATLSQYRADAARGRTAELRHERHVLGGVDRTLRVGDAVQADWHSTETIKSIFAHDGCRPKADLDHKPPAGAPRRPVQSRLSRNPDETCAMSLQCGIVGLPNVGKSTLFNALTKAGIAAENYPFCTIEPNTGVVEVPDPRLQQLAESSRPSASCRPSSSSSTSRAWWPAPARAKAWATSSWRTSARPTPSSTWCAASKTQRHPRGRQGRSDRRHRGDPDRAVPGRPGHVERAVQRYGKAAKSGNDKEAAAMLKVLGPVQAR
jgi:hypothetical protein